MSRSKYDHQHIYNRVKGGPFYRCIVIECPHKLHYDYLINRKARCPYCEQIFVITKEHLRRKIVHCLECTKIDQLDPFEELLAQSRLVQKPNKLDEDDDDIERTPPAA